MKAKVLIVEDHDPLRTSIQKRFVEEGFLVLVAESLAVARTQILEKPDLVIFDWMLPDGQGIDFLSEARNCDPHLPIIFLTARAEVVDKVLGLELGASDYMTKPFELRELIARVRTRLREKFPASTTTAKEQAVRVGSLVIDLLKHKASFAGRELDLVKKEFDLLTLLAEQPQKVFSRDEILNKVWGYDTFPTTRTVDTHIMQLRQKTSESLIETVRAVGYRLVPI